MCPDGAPGWRSNGRNEALSPAGWAGILHGAGAHGRLLSHLVRGVAPASGRDPTGMLLVPIVGVLSAAPIAGDVVGLRELSAMVLTLGGVTLALQKA